MEIAIPLLLIAVGFLIWKLNDVLGTQRGHLPTFEKPSDAPVNGEPDRAIDSEEHQNGESKDIPVEQIAAEADVELVTKGLKDIAANDPEFDPSSFLKGAVHAFDIIMSAFASGDRDALSSLVSKEVFDAFEAAMKNREEKNQTLRFTIFEEPIAQFETAELARGMAYIGVRIDSIQNGITYDAEDNILAGTPDQNEVVSNHWMFSRQINAKDPNWTLIKTAA